MPDCTCHRCTVELVKREPAAPEDMILGVIDRRLNRMFLCKTCGNKRCPHATDHRHACTGSNEPGQLGSRYAKPTPPEPPTDAVARSAAGKEALDEQNPAPDPNSGGG